MDSNYDFVSVFSLKTWLSRDHSSSQSGIINVHMLTNFSKVCQKKKKKKKKKKKMKVIVTWYYIFYVLSLKCFIHIN